MITKSAAALSLSSLALIGLSLYPAQPPKPLADPSPEEDYLSQAVARSLLRQVRGLLLQGKYDEAAALIDDYFGPQRADPRGAGKPAAAGDNEELGLLYRRAAASYSEGDFVAAAASLRRILDSHPQDPRARRYLAKVDALLRKREGAGK